MADLKQYWQELAKKAGLSDEKAKAVLDALGDETVHKAFAEGFVPTSHYHSTLDKQKGEYEGQLKAANEKLTGYDKWYRETAQPAYTQYQQAFQNLKRYEELYGPIENNADARRAATATGLTKEEVQKMLEQRDVAYASLSKDIAYATTDYLQRFKEPLDMDALEKYAIEKNLPIRQAYKEFVNPKLEEARTTEFEAKLKAAREEGARDALSKHKLPVDTKPREITGSFWDRKVVEAEKMTPNQQERHSREAFFEGWNNPEPAKAAS